MILCSPGYYCDVSSSVPTQAKCPAGTYSAAYGLKNANECIDCPAGYYCLEGTIDPTLTPCPIGSYCPEKTATSTGTPCEIGTYSSVVGTKAKTECLICEEGYYCVGG